MPDDPSLAQNARRPVSAERLRDRLRCSGHRRIEHLDEPVDRPIDLALIDGQGWREADGVAMGILGQHTDIDQPPHHRARVGVRRIELDAGEQAAAAIGLPPKVLP